MNFRDFWVIFLRYGVTEYIEFVLTVFYSTLSATKKQNWFFVHTSKTVRTFLHFTAEKIQHFECSWNRKFLSLTTFKIVNFSKFNMHLSSPKRKRSKKLDHIFKYLFICNLWLKTKKNLHYFFCNSNAQIFWISWKKLLWF